MKIFWLQLKQLGQLKGQEVWIRLEDDYIVFKWPYMFIKVERALIENK
jgi:hypothetical protein